MGVKSSVTGKIVISGDGPILVRTLEEIVWRNKDWERFEKKVVIGVFSMSRRPGNQMMKVWNAVVEDKEGRAPGSQRETLILNGGISRRNGWNGR